MIRKTKASNSSLFLIELILAILFFSITSAVCVQFFVKSHLLTLQSQELTHGANECAAVAEVCKTSGDAREAKEQLSELYPLGTVGTDTIEIYYDQDFVLCDAGNQTYTLKIQFNTQDTMIRVDMEMRGTDLIYELSTSYHTGRRSPYVTR